LRLSADANKIRALELFGCLDTDLAWEQGCHPPSDQRLRIARNPLEVAIIAAIRTFIVLRNAMIRKPKPLASRGCP
jgi:hypothetical protein